MLHIYFLDNLKNFELLAIAIKRKQVASLAA